MGLQGHAIIGRLTFFFFKYKKIIFTSLIHYCFLSSNKISYQFIFDMNQNKLFYLRTINFVFGRYKFYQFNNYKFFFSFYLVTHNLWILLISVLRVIINKQF